MSNKHLWLLATPVLCVATASAQSLPTITPKVKEINFENNSRIFKNAEKKNKQGKALNAQESRVYDETKENAWDVQGAACSWYCGGGPREVTASSNLAPTGDLTYDGSNAHDNSYKTAWVEGVKGYGIGEYLTYTFAGNSPRVTDVIVVNGYVKSAKAWKNNSRVKTLKMYIDGKPYALLELKDIMGEQSFHFPPIGNDPNQEQEEDVPDRTLKFEIVDVYKGDKYDDTAISEIYFDGIDVHCFVKGSKVLMADLKEKNIEDLKVGDKVITYKHGRETAATITALAKQPHNNIVTYKFENGTELSCTPDHPIFTTNKGWASLQPEKSALYEGFEGTKNIEIGDTVFSAKSNNLKIVGIEKRGTKAEDTYTITGLEWEHSSQDGDKLVKREICNIFVVNGVFVGVEKLGK